MKKRKKRKPNHWNETFVGSWIPTELYKALKSKRINFSDTIRDHLKEVYWK